ncbi:uncharacterized protein LOC129567665 isoform X2 [Sitodiplosis mosellana]|nr:uncharacterized protein LOC129567665 isoform X2 [Sitodiplosis mosellana]
MRWLNDPMNSRFPAFVCSCATWLTGMVIALPYPIYTTYLDLGLYFQRFHDVGICVVNLVDDSQEYTRGLFFLMYIAPSVILAYLYIHTAKDLRPPEGELSVMMYEQRADIIAHRHQRHSTTSSTRSRTSYGRSYDLYDAQTDATREQRTQYLLGTMAACEIICIGPLMVLRFARQQMDETYENSSHFDITYLLLIWVAFLPTIISPVMYSMWILSGPTKDRIWRYFRLSSRQSNSDNKLESQRSIENSITQENTTETLDIEAKIPLAPKTAHIISTTGSHTSKPTGKVNPTTANALKPKRPVSRTNPNRTSIRNKTVHKDLIRPERTRSSEEMNNSCSNITASTYINGNEVSTSSGIGVDFESIAATEQPKINFDRESVYSGVSNDRYSHRSHDRLSESGNLLLRRESSSTYERDMDIIDLLERERSVDLSEMIERERQKTERYRKKVPNTRTNSSVERRKLPDITKITAPSSPKRPITSAEQSNNFPNFVFTHQFNEFAEARSNRNRDSNSGGGGGGGGGVTSNVPSARSRNNSQTSFGKRNSDAHQCVEDDSSVGNLNRVARARSIDSRKSSTKSIHDNRIVATNSTNYTTGSMYANKM